MTITVRRTSSRSTSTPLKQPEHGRGQELAQHQQPDRHRRVRQLEDQPGRRDVLHPGPGDRDDLARRRRSGSSGACGGSSRCGGWPAVTRRSRVVLEQPAERGKRSLERGELLRLEAPESRREPGSAPAPGGAQDANALIRQRQLDPTPIAHRASPCDQAAGLEAVNRGGHRGRRHTFPFGELAHADSRVRADRPEERCLAAGDSERRELLAQLPVQVKERRPEPVRNCKRVRDQLT